jgi:glucose/arabinose dehydrogenase
VRDIAEGPDGFIYVLTDGPENAVLRIEPAAP